MHNKEIYGGRNLEDIFAIATYDYWQYGIACDGLRLRRSVCYGNGLEVSNLTDTGSANSMVSAPIYLISIVPRCVSA